MAMATSSPRSYSSSPASRRTVRPRPSAAWRPGQVRPSRSVRRTGGPSPATSRALLSMPGLRLSRRRSPRRRPPGGQSAGRQRGRQDAGHSSAADGGLAGRGIPDGRARAGAAARRRGGRAGKDAGPLGWVGAGPGRAGGDDGCQTGTGRRGQVGQAHGLAVAGDGYDAVQLASTLELNGQWLPSGLSDFTLV